MYVSTHTYKHTPNSLKSPTTAKLEHRQVGKERSSTPEFRLGSRHVVLPPSESEVTLRQLNIFVTSRPHSRQWRSQRGALAGRPYGSPIPELFEHLILHFVIFNHLTSSHAHPQKRTFEAENMVTSAKTNCLLLIPSVRRPTTPLVTHGR